MYIAHIRSDGTAQSCVDHCRNTALTAASLLSSTGLSSVGYLAGILHDMGKFSDDFLLYITTVSGGNEYKGKKVIHSFTGVSYILGRKHNGDSFEKLTAEIIALAVGSHHGLFDIYREAEDYNGFIYRIEKQPEYDKTSISNFLSECASEEEIDELFARSVDEVRKFHITFSADLKKDNDMRKSRTVLFFYFSMLSRLVLSAVVEGDRRDTASFMSGKDRGECISLEWDSILFRFNSFISSFSPDTEMQKARMRFSDACSDFAAEDGGIYRLDIPTGGGKTLSSLRYALCHARIHKKRRIFYVAPLLTILEQNAAVIMNAVGRENILLHYSNIADEYATGDELDERELLQDSWGEKIVVTTLVQMLMTLFSGRMSSVRRFNALAGSIIIFDEIQSLPMKVYSMFNLAVNFLSGYCGTTVILCSATLPSFDSTAYRMAVSEKPMINPILLNETREVFKRTQIKEWKGEISLRDVPSVILSQHESSESVLVVCNTKKEAAFVFNELKSRTTDPLFHLSAGMCPEHRRNMLAELSAALVEGKKLICVSTQVIEAGIDISFSTVFRFASGIDSIVQSAGRCNRNGADSNPHDVYILKVIDESLTGLGEIQNGKNALFNLLEQFKKRPQDFGGDISSASSIDYYYHVLFSALGAGAHDYPNPEGGDRPDLLSFLSVNTEFDRDGTAKRGRRDYLFSQSFKTAGSLFSVFDDKQKTVVVPYNDEARNVIAMLQSCSVRRDFVKMEKLMKRARDFSVSIFNFTFDLLKKGGALTEVVDLGVFFLHEEYYDDYTGVSNKEVKECDTIML